MTPENIRNPLVFWYFQGVYKNTTSLNLLEFFSFGKRFVQGKFKLYLKLYNFFSWLVYSWLHVLILAMVNAFTCKSLKTFHFHKT